MSQQRKVVQYPNGKLFTHILKSCRECGAEEYMHPLTVSCEKCHPKNKPKNLSCRDCGKPTGADHAVRKYCYECGSARDIATVKRHNSRPPTNDNNAARKITKYAIGIGFLLHPSNYICMDCKKYQAACYDHRDYSKPLEVDAVCLRCNSSRGKGVEFHKPALTE